MEKLQVLIFLNTSSQVFTLIGEMGFTFKTLILFLITVIDLINLILIVISNFFKSLYSFCTFVGDCFWLCFQSFIGIQPLMCTA